VFSNAVNTVSQRYAEEITMPEYGERLDSILRFIKQARHNLRGLLNGADYEEWGPERDSYLEYLGQRDSRQFLYSASDLSGKVNAKAELQRVYGLPVQEDVMVIGTVSRLTEQKGFNLFVKIGRELADKRLQIVVVGTGDDEIVNAIKALESANQEKIGIRIGFDPDLAKLVMAGSDAFIMFSRFEPCGLTQMYSMARGVLPIVRGTGGLADTVQDGVTGFVFEAYTREAALCTVERAMNIYYNQPQTWQSMIQQAMAQRFTWENSARGYLDMYEMAKGVK
jgi:starch synthase